MSNGADKTLRLLIEATDAASPALAKVAAEQEALTNSGKGLATGVPDLDAATKKFTISTEAEYIAVAKAHEALRARIPVMEAAGESTVKMTAAVANLDAALSTDSALQIAQNMEGKQWLATRLEQIAATEAATAATEKNSAANLHNAESAGLNAFQMREMMVVANELERGNFSRLPGSLARLASSFDLLGALFNPITLGLVGVGVAAYELNKHLEEVNVQANELADNFRIVDDVLSNADGAEAVGNAFAAMSEKGEDAVETTNKLADATKALNDATNAENTALSQATQFQIEENNAKEKALLAQVKLDVQTGKLTPKQGADREEQLNREFGFENDQAKSKAEQTEIDNLKKERTGQQGITDDANSKIEAAKIKQQHDQDAADVAKEAAAIAKQEHEKQEKFLKEHGSELSPADFEKAMGRNLDLGQNQAAKEEAAGDAQTQANQSKADYDALKQGLRAATDALKGLDQKISGLETSHTASDQHRDTMEGLTNQAGQTQHDIQVNEIVQRQIEANKGLEKIFARYGGGIDDMIAIIRAHVEKTTSHDAEIQALRNALNALGGQNAASQNIQVSG